MTELLRGRVVRTDAKVCHVEIGDEVVQCAPRGKLFDDLGMQKNPIAVGDWVLVDLKSVPSSIEEVLERENYLGRMASSHDPREQVLVSNVDRMFIIGSVKTPGFSSNRTDRILVACAWHGIPATLVLNKTDLAREGELDALRSTYEDANVDVLETCATEGLGLDALRDALEGKVSVFYGASGAGKSTLLNALQPELGLKVGRISNYWKSGRHTTSYSQLHHLDFGGWVIDTPGIRVFRLHGMHKHELRNYYPEIHAAQVDCRFPDCTHDHEPDCAVIEAAESGKIPPTRYQSYLEILDELAPPPLDDTPEDPPDLEPE